MNSNQDKMDAMLVLVQQFIDTSKAEYTENPCDEVKYAGFVFDWLWEALEELTQLRVRLEQLNEPVIDPLTGEQYHQCSPYNIERLKMQIKMLKDSGNANTLPPTADMLWKEKYDRLANAIIVMASSVK